MPHEFDPGRPIYVQLVELITQAIASGEFTPGQRLPGVREMALQYGVNPNTAQRTMAELERQGLVYSERTTGRFVTTDQEKITQTRRGAALEQACVFLRQMRKLGIAQEEIAALLQQAEAQDGKGEPHE